MTWFEIYVFILCLLVFVLLVGLSTYFLYTHIKHSIKLIRYGDEDENLIKEYSKAQAKKKKNVCKGIEITVSLLSCLLLCAVFTFSLIVNIRKDTYSDNVPTLQVVKSGSMSTKNDKNEYLVINKLDNQIQTFDVILAYKAPEEKDIKLYDIVVYKVDDAFLIHRIVGIEEPNEEHPDERYFLCQGDANERPDRFPVKYEQIRGIYRGERVPFVGSFILFMQSPAGWLCIMLLVGAIIATPMLEKTLEKAKRERLEKILGSDENVLQKIKDQVTNKVNEETVVKQPKESPSVKVFGVYNTQIVSNDKYFYVDPSTGLKVYSSHPIRVDKSDRAIEIIDVEQLEMSEKIK